MVKISISAQKYIKTHFYNLICLILILISLGLIIHRAWFCDDSFITFRTLDNFTNGHLLKWNTYERVQAYTHPLWLFLLIPIYAITHEIFLTVITVSVLLSALSLFFLYGMVEDKKQLVFPLVALTVSNAFINYATSGLENALLNLLLCLFVVLYVKKQNHRFFYILIFLLASLIALTRLDAILIVLPTLIYLFFYDKNKFFRKILASIIGFTPLIVWEIFSLFYYGFPFPNTFYAKLAGGFPLSEYLQRGVSYFFDAVTRDPVTIIGLFIGISSFFYLRRRLKPLSLGIFLYFLYVFYIGGDFMTGRMYASLFFFSMVLIAQNEHQIKNWILLLSTSAIIFFGFVAECPTPFLLSTKPLSNTKFLIMDERRFYQTGTGLFRNNRINTSVEMDEDIWPFTGHSWIAQERLEGRVKEKWVFIMQGIGLFGYYGGPDIKVIDDVGLADPLIARLPAIKNPDWRVGHLVRAIPEGYKESITDSNNKIANSQIEEYNSHLKVLTQSDLFSKGRLLEILRFNLGYYDHLVK